MDIDVDFEFELREQVIDYTKQKYGAECVSRIITFGTMAAKGAVLDMARVLEYPVSLARKINELIPNAPKMTIKKAMLENVELANLYNTDEDVKTIIDLALKVEGLIKNTSCHACGVIIAPDDITKFCPQTFAYDEETKTYERTTQFTMGECEEIGLLKMDFLGLRTESVIKEAITDIHAYYGVELNSYDNNDIPLNDVKVYQNLLAKGDTAGVFQIEGVGITNIIKQLYEDINEKVKAIESNPLLTDEGKELAKTELGDQCFERLIAGISLYRPGPMDEIPRYVRGIQDERTISYDTPELEPILKNTYGVLVYQEQVMLTVRALAGFTAGQADNIRKGMGKKKQEILDEYKPYFIYGSGNAIDSHTNQPYNIKGCVANGIDEVVAETIWGKMESFAKYAFNKSHAAAYAVVAIQTAWLAYYYPIIFMKANLNVYKGNPDKLNFYLGNCSKMGIKVLPPSVNSSDFDFTLNDDASAIVFGLSGIKNVGKVAKGIIEEREIRGKFTSFLNFVERMLKYQQCNSRALESLAKVGALDCFGGSRKSKVDYLTTLVDIVKSEKSFEYPGQSTIYELGEEINLSDAIVDLKNIPIPNDTVEYEKKEYLSLEEEFAGFYLSGHPLNDYEDVLRKGNYMDITTLTDSKPMGITEVAGLVTNVDKKYSKNNKPFVIFSLKDKASSVNCVVWSDILEQNEHNIVEGTPVLLTGKVSENDFGVQFTVSSVTKLSEIKRDVKNLKVYSTEDIVIAREQYQKAYTTCLKYPGNVEIKFVKQLETFDLPSVNYSNELLQELQDIFTEDKVKFEMTE